jgi:D-glycero-D-manno-heptose 1,7-bisphosphate phosphatase
MSRAVFLDRDGVINQKPPEGDYIIAWEDFHILPGVAEAIILLNQAGFRVIVVTNQRCIAKGLITAAGVEAIHKRMTDSLSCAGATIEATYYCPHEEMPACRCRKPAPGMLLEAANSRGIELGTSWMIGDSGVDMEAGKKVGCMTAFIAPDHAPEGQASLDRSTLASADISAASLLDAVHKILSREEAVIESGAILQRNRLAPPGKHPYPHNDSSS